MNQKGYVFSKNTIDVDADYMSDFNPNSNLDTDEMINNIMKNKEGYNNDNNINVNNTYGWGNIDNIDSQQLNDRYQDMKLNEANINSNLKINNNKIKKNKGKPRVTDHS